MMNTTQDKFMNIDDESFDMDAFADEPQIGQKKVIYAEARFNSGGISEAKFHSRDILAEAKLYMDLVLPSEKEGERFFVIKHKSKEHPSTLWSEYPYMFKEDVIRRSFELSAQGYNAYVALGRFKKGFDDYNGIPEWNRGGDNVTARRSLALDIDPKGDNKSYSSKSEAIEAFEKFLRETGIPKPTLIIISGNGVHIYWAFDEDVAADDWQQLADNLKALCKKCGFLADDAVTADRARVLRLPGTSNCKDTNPAPLPVKIIGGTKGVYSFGDLEEVINSALENVKGVDRSNPSTKPNNLRDCHDSFLSEQPDYISNAEKSGKLRHDVIDSDNEETEENIERVRGALASLDPDVSYAFWKDCIWAVASLRWNCGLDLVDEWSKRGAEYRDATKKGNSGRGAVKELYDQYDPKRNSKIGLGSLIVAAKEAGWQDPRSNRSADSFDLPDDGGVSAGVSLIDQIIQKIPKGCIVKPVFTGRQLNDEKIQYIMAGQEGKQTIDKRSFKNIVTMLKDPQFIRLLTAKGHSYPIYNELLNDLATSKGENWEDTHVSAVRILCEEYKGVCFSERDIYRACEYVAKEYMSYHPVKDYLNSLKWDGVSRVETLFIDVLGAEDNTYTREATKCFFVAAIRRAYEPGYKFDNVPILLGGEGIYKSGFISQIGKFEFFVELDTYDAKKAVEKTQGKWIVEIPELSATKKSEVEHEKAFISATVDKVRLSYDRRAKEFKRQFVMMGTTNEEEFLKSKTGNRRWWPMVCHNKVADIESLKASIDMIWAEALHLHQIGASTLLSDEALAICKEKTKQHEIVDPWEHNISNFLVEERVKKSILKTCVDDILENCLDILPKEKKSIEYDRVRHILNKQPDWFYDRSSTHRIHTLKRSNPIRSWLHKSISK